MANGYMHDPRKAVAAAMTLLDQEQQDLADALTERTGKPWTVNMIASMVKLRRKLHIDELLLIQEIQGFPLDWYLYGPFGGDRLSKEATGLYLGSIVSEMPRSVDLIAS